MRDRIYLDHAATTAVSAEVREAMAPFLAESYGNPSAVYATGREARRAVDQARRKAAEALGAAPREIYFTSGGSESDNWAVLGTALTNVQEEYNVLYAVVNGFATAAGFAVAICILAGIREKMRYNNIPKPFQGMPIVLVTAGLMAIAFCGFSGLL